MKTPILCKFDQETIDAARERAEEESLPLNRWIENTLKRVLGLLGTKKAVKKSRSRTER